MATKSKKTVSAPKIKTQASKKSLIGVGGGKEVAKASKVVVSKRGPDKVVARAPMAHLAMPKAVEKSGSAFTRPVKKLSGPVTGIVHKPSRSVPKMGASSDSAVEALLNHLKVHFPTDTVAVKRSGVRNRLNVLLVSSQLDGLTNAEKEKRLWDLIQSAPISEVDKAGIGFALALGTDDFI